MFPLANDSVTILEQAFGVPLFHTLHYNPPTLASAARISWAGAVTDSPDTSDAGRSTWVNFISDLMIGIISLVYNTFWPWGVVFAGVPIYNPEGWEAYTIFNFLRYTLFRLYVQVYIEKICQGKSSNYGSGYRRFFTGLNRIFQRHFLSANLSNSYEAN